MHERANRKQSLLGALLLGGLLAAAANAEAATPWFRPGGARPNPSVDRNVERAPEGGWGSGVRDRDRERQREDGRGRGLYRERRFIEHLYQGFLNRRPSQDELRYWTDRLGRDANPTELVQEFMDSDEFFVRETFRGLLRREPDAGGMRTYLRVLQDGQSRSEVVESILSSEEFRKKFR